MNCIVFMLLAAINFICAAFNASSDNRGGFVFSFGVGLIMVGCMVATWPK